MKYIKRIKRAIGDMVAIYVRQRVTRSAAAMSYYITMSIFPFLICVHAILSSLSISDENIFGHLREIVPPDVLEIILGYLRYIGGNKTTLMFVVGVAVMITSSSSAFHTIIKIMADMQGRSRYTGLRAVVYSAVLALGLLAVIYASALVIVTGEWLLNLLRSRLGFEFLLDLWSWVRFAILFLLLFVIIYLIYYVTAPKEARRSPRMPGALLASFLLVAGSIVFSRMIGAAVKYPLVYGSLASFIILMFWIYICSIILIMGNVFNFVVFKPKPAPAPTDDGGDAGRLGADNP